jgi:hypothetical protein
MIHKLSIDEATWQKLEALRKKEGLRSVAETVRELLPKA